MLTMLTIGIITLFYSLENLLTYMYGRQHILATCRLQMLRCLLTYLVAA